MKTGQWKNNSSYGSESGTTYYSEIPELYKPKSAVVRNPPKITVKDKTFCYFNPDRVYSVYVPNKQERDSKN